jgi:NAD(P)-dependent dehydrogenase (short-subunit alcohol dehydrogenase family)
MSKAMLITGGSRGIGAATALLAAKAGFDVAVNYRTNSDAAAAVVTECQRLGQRATAIQGNVAEETDVVAMFDAAEAELGPITSLVNNAGILHQQMRVDQMTAARWREVFEVNVIGTLLCAREAVRRMSTSHGGAGGTIVNVSSAASYLGSPNEYVDYAATKGAVDSLTIGLGREVASEGIRVNAVRPGIIDTEIHASGGEPGRLDRIGPTIPMKRGGTAEEVADVILWLASEESSYLTATLINCSGGR